MELGVHLPIADLGEGSLDVGRLRAYAATAAGLDYATLAASDHLVWRRPLLDGPTALTSVLADAGDMALATSVALPTLRHPVVLAKWLTTVGTLSGNRVIAGLGPGSSADDYAAVGLPYDERWQRFDESFGTVRALVRGEATEPGRFHDAATVDLEPRPARAIEVWSGSWGSDRRLHASARDADGWIASAYNTTPARFSEARARLDGHLLAAGRDPRAFPDMVSTMWTCVTPDRATADALIADVMAPLLRRAPDELTGLLAIGPAEHCIELLRAYRDAGARQMLLWPIRDPVGQLTTIAEQVRPHLDA